MNDHHPNAAYLNAVAACLHTLPRNTLTRADRRRALAALAAQLDELSTAGLDPHTALGAPAEYAAELLAALTEQEGGSRAAARFRVLSVPLETQALSRADVRSRIWAPDNPRLIVPRLFGAGWALNLGALAVKLRLIRPDDATADVLDEIPQRTARAAQLVPLALACATVAGLGLVWRRLPSRVPADFGLGGRPKRWAAKRSLLGIAAVGVIPAAWAARRGAGVEDGLVRAASATTAATVSAAAVAAAVLQARRPRGRFGLLIPAAFPVAVMGALTVVAVPLRAGLRRAWRAVG